MSKGGTPVRSKHELELVLNHISQKRECYHIIFDLILETGMPLERIREFKASDIRSEVVAFSPIHKGITRTEHISDRLQGEIREYLNGKGDNELAFTSVDGTKPICERGFQKALSAASAFYNIKPPVTSERLRRTYIYNLFLKRDFGKIRAITGCRGIKEIYEYLNIPTPGSKNEKRLESYSKLDALIKEDLLLKAKMSVTSSLDEAMKNLAKDDVSVAYTEKVMEFANALIKAADEFADSQRI